MTRQIPWLRVFVEGVVIVGSILTFWPTHPDELGEFAATVGGSVKLRRLTYTVSL